MVLLRLLVMLIGMADEIASLLTKKPQRGREPGILGVNKMHFDCKQMDPELADSCFVALNNLRGRGSCSFRTCAATETNGIGYCKVEERKVSCAAATMKVPCTMC